MVRKFCLFRKFFGKFTPKKAKKSTNSFFMVGVKKKKIYDSAFCRKLCLKIYDKTKWRKFSELSIDFAQTQSSIRHKRALPHRRCLTMTLYATTFTKKYL